MFGSNLVHSYRLHTFPLLGSSHVSYYHIFLNLENFNLVCFHMIVKIYLMFDYPHGMPPFLRMFFFQFQVRSHPYNGINDCIGKSSAKTAARTWTGVDRVYTGSFMTSLDMAGLLSLAIAFYLNRYCIFSEFYFFFFRLFNFHHEGRWKNFATSGCCNQGSILACWCCWSVNVFECYLFT